MSSGSTRKLRVNDDGPPGPESPYIFGWYRHLTQDLGWDVKVVIPSTQKSWIGKAYHIQDIIKGRYYYPKGADGQGETSPSPRSLREGEIGEWILLDATPASCANIALHNLFPGEIDLVISGPNFGRNTSSAFSLSSGTLGAALASSLSGFRSIALSYGIMIKNTPTTYHDPAFKLSSKIVNYLLGNWGPRENKLLYSINIPMIEELLHDDEMKVYWTSVWKSDYGRLFKEEGSLVFAFQPDLSGLLSKTAAPEGSDGWALNVGAVSVTPYLTSFAELPEDEHGFSCLQDREWKFKL
ncbi:sure-like protein [Thelephora ganbajun]|uniref:Sure-like protein n=1 Tax=Thelephora ganbajun TaxID=370292 RepID=A0ACB6ZPG4_THEGA|nr:sure-like protein [Thelephora ganbajun]